MTRRERAEARLERRREWAEKRRTAANAQLNSHPEIRHDWAFITQPGHIPFRARMNAADDRACASLKVADHHEAKAAGITHQLDRTIFSDDTDAPERLRERIAELEARRAQNTRDNAAYRKAPGADPAAKLTACVEAGTMTRAAALDAAGLFGSCHWEKQPHPPYENANLGGNIARLRKRLVEIEARAKDHAAADAAPGGVVVQGDDYVRVTFAEKPERSILDALRAAGFRWSGGSWCGYRNALPEGIATT